MCVSWAAGYLVPTISREHPPCLIYLHIDIATRLLDHACARLLDQRGGEKKREKREKEEEKKEKEERRDWKIVNMYLPAEN